MVTEVRTLATHVASSRQWTPLRYLFTYSSNYMCFSIGSEIYAEALFAGMTATR